MPLRFKFATAFCSILLLTVTIAITSWWGMETAIARQNQIFTLNLNIDTLLSTLILEEKSFLSSKSIHHAHAVSDTIKEFRRILKDQVYELQSRHPRQFATIREDLAHYNKEFELYTKQVIAVATFESRLTEESDRILAHTQQLSTKSSNQALAMSGLVTRMLQAEKKYVITGSEQSMLAVNRLIVEISALASKLQFEKYDSAHQLRAYRIRKVADIYRDILFRYIDEKENIKAMTDHMNGQRAPLADQLRALINQELNTSRGQIDQLKIICFSVSIVAIVMAALITVFLPVLITKPIEKFKKSANDILQGNLETRVQVTTHDEIGELADIFNQMTARLNQSFGDILNSQDKLEELVSERTLELKKEVTERSVAEAALRASETQLRTIVDNAPMGIILWDEKFQVADWNNAASQIFGYSSAEIMGQPAHRLLEEEMHSYLDSIWVQLLKEKESIRSQNENITKDGHTILCDWFNKSIHDSSGQMIGALSLVENVTEKLQREKELLKIEKLESTGILAGGIAHDFNNILTAILGNINLSLHDENLTDKTKSLLKAAEKASFRAKSLTQQLLTFAKGGEPIRESTSLAEIIEDSSTFVLHGGNVSCSYSFAQDLKFALVDRGQISQVIQNIVLNARHAMPDGGNIRIVCENIIPGKETYGFLDPHTEYIKIIIKDSGIGMSQKMIDKIFDPYFTTKQEGSGLGLAITLSIINKHNGHVIVNSEQDNGTEFMVFLPAAPTDVKRANDQLQRDDTTPSFSILVMDDDESVQLVLKSMLEALGHRVTLANDGAEAIAIYSELTSAHQNKFKSNK